eukprot:scaffold585_cov330-Pavlova_lutheri.AAC.22
MGTSCLPFHRDRSRFGSLSIRHPSSNAKGTLPRFDPGSPASGGSPIFHPGCPPSWIHPRDPLPIPFVGLNRALGVPSRAPTVSRWGGGWHRGGGVGDSSAPRRRGGGGNLFDMRTIESERNERRNRRTGVPIRGAKRKGRPACPLPILHGPTRQVPANPHERLHGSRLRPPPLPSVPRRGGRPDPPPSPKDRRAILCDDRSWTPPEGSRQVPPRRPLQTRVSTTKHARTRTCLLQDRQTHAQEASDRVRAARNGENERK